MRTTTRVSKRICKVQDCVKTVHGHDYCIKHYKQIYRYGKLTDSIYDPRPAIIDGNIARIPLGVNAKQGYAIVDKEFAWLDKYKWLLSNGYAKTTTERRGITKGMHRFVLGDKANYEIDHINNDKLDNRSANLRHCTHHQNTLNQAGKRNNPIGFKGITFHKKAQKFTAQIIYKGSSYYLGLHKTAEEAAIAYDIKAKELHGEYAKLNFDRETI